MVAVERLAHDGIADPVARAHGPLDGAHRLGPRHRQTGGREQPGRELLVAGDVHRERGRVRRHGRPDASLVNALPELHEGVLVEPQPGDVARDGLVEDGLGRRAEGGALGGEQEALELAVEVELRVGPHEVVDQPHGEAARRQADALVDVPVDDVVLTVLAGAARLAPADVVAGLLLQLQGGVLGDVTEPGALLEPLEEAAAVAPRARVPGDAGQRVEQPVDEPGQGVGREVLERTEVDDQVDRRLEGPHVRTAVDAGLQDREVGTGGAHWSLTGCSLVLLRLVAGASGVVLLERDETAFQQVEAGTGGQRVDDRPGNEQRGTELGERRVGDDRRAVSDEDAAGADDLEQPLAADDGGGVLVDADAEQAGGARDEREQPAVARRAGRSAGR